MLSPNPTLTPPHSIPQPKQTILSPSSPNWLRRVNTFLVAIHSLTQFNLTWDLSFALTENALAKISSDLIAKFRSFFPIHPLKLDRVGHHLFAGRGGSPTTLFYITHLFELLFCSSAALHYFPDFPHLSSCPDLQTWYNTYTSVSRCACFISTPHPTREF